MQITAVVCAFLGSLDHGWSLVVVKAHKPMEHTFDVGLTFKGAIFSCEQVWTFLVVRVACE